MNIDVEQIARKLLSDMDRTKKHLDGQQSGVIALYEAIRQEIKRQEEESSNKSRREEGEEEQTIDPDK